MKWMTKAKAVVETPAKMAHTLALTLAIALVALLVSIAAMVRHA